MMSSIANCSIWSALEYPRKEAIQSACANPAEPIYRLETRPRSPKGNGAGARSSAGEHYVDIVGVTGSIPVAPTILQCDIKELQSHHLKGMMGTRPSDTKSIPTHAISRLPA